MSRSHTLNVPRQKPGWSMRRMLAFSEQVEVVCELDTATYDTIVYPAVMLKSEGAFETSHAREFFRFLLSSEAEAVFRKNGFARAALPK